jgi:Na+-translocating ferredoxin:NAD+ oxidoreductase subunit G
MTAKKNNALSGVVLQLFIQGWGGKIQFIMGVDANGEITGVRVINHKETPGLADKIEVAKSPWITSFNGKSLANTEEKKWAVKKDGGEYDQFAGATITPRAVVKGVHQGMLFYQQWLQQQAAQLNTSTQAEKTP